MTRPKIPLDERVLDGLMLATDAAVISYRWHERHVTIDSELVWSARKPAGRRNCLGGSRRGGRSTQRV